MHIDLGSLAIDDRRDSLGWVNQLQRYKWFRFFGFSNARVFIGFMVASSKGADPETWADERVKFHEKQLRWAQEDQRAIEEHKLKETTHAK